MKVEDIISCLERSLNEESLDSCHCLVLHKTIESTSFKAYAKHNYILYDVINDKKLRLFTFLYIAKVDKKYEDKLKEELDRLFVKGLLKFIGTNYNNIKDKNYEAIKV